MVLWLHQSLGEGVCFFLEFLVLAKIEDTKKLHIHDDDVDKELDRKNDVGR